MKRILLIAGHKANNNYVASTGTYEGMLNREVVHTMVNTLNAYCQCKVYPVKRDCYKDNKNGSIPSGFEFSHFDYIFEVHFNSYNTLARGASVQIHSKYRKGISVETSVAKALQKYFKLRGEEGIIRRNDLLNMNTAFKLGVDYALVEVCFHDNVHDYSTYRLHAYEIANDIAYAIVKAFGLSPIQKAKTIVGCDYLNLRKMPNGEVLEEMAVGETVHVIGEEPDSDGDMWMKVERKLNGHKGYAWGDYLL